MSAKRKPPNGKCDHHGGKLREQIHRTHVRWLDKQEENERGRIDAVAYAGSRKQLAIQFGKLRLQQRAARKAEHDSLATTSLKDIVK